MPLSFAPVDLTLSSDEVHVWRARLDLPPSRVHRLEQLLTADERTRASRFRFSKDQYRFIVARGILRLIVGRYLKIDPSRVRFHASHGGKPGLAGETRSHPLRFNVSHSGGVALYAVACGRELGVDVERLSGLADPLIAERFFSPREAAMLRALPAEMQAPAFFTLWTLKEAYVKARGEGLRLRLDRFTVWPQPQGLALLEADDDPWAASSWSLRVLAPGPGYAGALAVEGHDWRLKCWEWAELPGGESVSSEPDPL